MTSEAGDTLPAFKGDTPDPSQGLPPVEMLLESTHLAITPIPDPVTPLPEFVVEEIGEIGDTPNPGQGLLPVEGQPPVVGRPQGSPLLYTVAMVDLSTLPMYRPHSTLGVD